MRPETTSRGSAQIKVRRPEENTRWNEVRPKLKVNRETCTYLSPCCIDIMGIMWKAIIFGRVIQRIAKER